MRHIANNDAKIIESMQNFIAKTILEYESHPETAKEKAKAALIRTGIITADGRLKEQIVTRY